MAAKKRTLDWESTPEWRRTVERVRICYARGMGEDAIHAIIPVERKVLKKILEDEEAADQIAKETYRKKIPTIQEIINLSLNAMNLTLRDMAVNEDFRKQMISKVSDLSALAKTVESLNMLLRLELGKSTNNAAVKLTYEKAQEALSDMTKVDPIFDWTKLPEPKKID